MYKKILALALAALTVFSLAGCGKTNEVKYMKDIKGAEWVDLCDYVGIPVVVKTPEISDDYLEQYIEYSLSQDAKYESVSDHKDVRDGDTVKIDYVGKKDGEAFAGGTANDANLTIGSGRFIDGFESGLIGSKIGDVVDLNLTFPENYQSEELAGQDVVFTVTIKDIVELVTPELTDEYVESLGQPKMKTVEDYRNVCYNYLFTLAAQSWQSEVEQQIFEYLEKNCTIKKEVPEEMVGRFADDMLNYYTNAGRQYNMNLQQYVEFMVSTDEEREAYEAESAALQEKIDAAIAEGKEATDVTSVPENYVEPLYIRTIRGQAEATAKRYIIIKAIADKENLFVTGKAYKNALSSAAAEAGYTDVETYKEKEDAEALRDDLTVRAVMKFLRENAEYSEPEIEEAE